MNTSRTIVPYLFAITLASAQAFAASPVARSDPLAAIDLNRNAIVADIAKGFEGDRAALTARLAGLRADRLLAASLASSRESLETILAGSEKAASDATNRAVAKSLGNAGSDLVYTPITPCRLVDTRGFAAPIQGGAFAPNERRAYAPNGLCGLPTSGVATILVSFTTLNITPDSGGFLAMVAPNAAVSTSVDIFNPGSIWSSSNTAISTGSGAQFDVLVAQATAHVVVDVLGYFASPRNTGTNLGVGEDTLARNTVGDNNTALGFHAMENNTVGSNNTAVGNEAMLGNTLGFTNTAIGTSALTSNTSGSSNTAIGAAALLNNLTGVRNTALGTLAAAHNLTGNVNTALGAGALVQNETGGNNIAIGVDAGSLTHGNNNILIGNHGDPQESNTVRLGELHARTFIAGIRGVATGVNDGVAVFIDSTGQLGTLNSSGRFKDDVEDMDESTSGLMKLRPVTFHYKSDQKPGGRTLQYGLIAEEVAEVYPGLVAHSPDGQVETVMYQFLPTMLLNEFQKQQRKLDAQAAEIAALKELVKR